MVPSAYAAALAFPGGIAENSKDMFNMYLIRCARAVGVRGRAHELSGPVDEVRRQICLFF